MRGALLSGVLVVTLVAITVPAGAQSSPARSLGSPSPGANANAAPVSDPEATPQRSLARRLGAPEAVDRAPASDTATALAIGGAVAVGAAVISVGVWIYSFARIMDINADPTWASYRDSVPAGTTDACVLANSDLTYGAPGEQAHARRICAEGGTLEALEWISLGGAAVAIGIAVGLFVASDRAASEQRVTVTPLLGPRTAGLNLELSF